MVLQSFEYRVEYDPELQDLIDRLEMGNQSSFSELEEYMEYRIDKMIEHGLTNVEKSVFYKLLAEFNEKKHELSMGEIIASYIYILRKY